MPFALILMALVEANGAGTTFLHVIGIALDPDCAGMHRTVAGDIDVVTTNRQVSNRAPGLPPPHASN